MTSTILTPYTIGLAIVISSFVYRGMSLHTEANVLMLVGAVWLGVLVLLHAGLLKNEVVE